MRGTGWGPAAGPSASPACLSCLRILERQIFKFSCQHPSQPVNNQLQFVNPFHFVTAVFIQNFLEFQGPATAGCFLILCYFFKMFFVFRLARRLALCSGDLGGTWICFPDWKETPDTKGPHREGQRETLRRLQGGDSLTPRHLSLTHVTKQSTKKCK